MDLNLIRTKLHDAEHVERCHRSNLAPSGQPQSDCDACADARMAKAWLQTRLFDVLDYLVDRVPAGTV